jgi:hypothetical protein
MTPQTIDEVLAELDQIILRARNERDRLGFFATLYRNVTIKVKEGIAARLFEDGPRMEKLDVTAKAAMSRMSSRCSVRCRSEDFLTTHLNS